MKILQGLRRRTALACAFLAPAQAAFAARDPYQTDPRGIVLLVVGLLAGILGLYAAKAVAREVLWFFQHRRSCKIPAVLETKVESFEGHITVIGLTGCRFQPLNKSTEGRLQRLLASPVFHDYDVRIKNRAHPVFVDGFYMLYAPLYFYDAIHRDELRDLLHLSKVPPDLAPRIGRPTTGKQHREEIARRRAAIDRLKHAVHAA